MKSNYIIQGTANQVADTKTVNALEKITRFILKALIGAGITSLIAILLVVMCIGFQEMPNRYATAVAQFEKHQTLNEKFKANSLNE